MFVKSDMAHRIASSCAMRRLGPPRQRPRVIWGAWGHAGGSVMTEGRVTVVWEVWGGRVIGGVRSTGLGAGRIRSRAGISKQRLPHTIQLFDSTLPLAIARREQQGGKSSDRTAGTAVVSSACRVAITSARHFDWPQRVIKPLSSLAASASRAQLVIWSVSHLVSQSFGQSVSQSVTWSVVGRRSSVVGRSVVGQSVVGWSVGHWSVDHSVGRLVPRERRSRASASGVEASGVEASGERQARLIGTS